MLPPPGSALTLAEFIILTSRHCNIAHTKHYQRFFHFRPTNRPHMPSVIQKDCFFPTEVSPAPFSQVSGHQFIVACSTPDDFARAYHWSWWCKKMHKAHHSLSPPHLQFNPSSSPLKPEDVEGVE
jgi:hypothetical protein